MTRVSMKSVWVAVAPTGLASTAFAQGASPWELKSDTGYAYGKDGKTVQSLLYIPQNAGLDGQPAANARLQFGSQAPEYELRVTTPRGEALLTGKPNGDVRLDLPGQVRS